MSYLSGPKETLNLGVKVWEGLGTGSPALLLLYSMPLAGTVPSDYNGIQHFLWDYFFPLSKLLTLSVTLTDHKKQQA